MKNICFLIDHIFDLILFLGIKNILKNEHDEVHVIALVTSHKYIFESEDTREILDEFDDVITVVQPSFQKNFIKHMHYSSRFIKTIRGIKKKYTNVKFITANRSELTTQLIMKYSKCDVIRILQRNPLSITDKSFSRKYQVNYRLTAIRNLYEICLALPLSTSYRARATKNLKYFFYKNENKKNDLFLVNRNIKPKFDEINFPYSFGKCQVRTSPKIYFFGSRFLGWDFLDNDKAVKTINSVLRMIERKYPNNTELIYKPHPLETDEHLFLSLNKFKVSKELTSAEILFVKYTSDISAVYSLGSTASKTAFNFGINAYVCYPLLNFKNDVEEKFDSLFDGMEDWCFIKDVKEIGDFERKVNFNINTTNLRI